MTNSPLVTEKQLARTYDSRAYADTWDAVEDYRRVRDYAHRNPSKGSSAIASTLELPRGRIRPWLDESKPDAVRGLETAHEYGWLECGYGDAEFTALNTLVANVFSGGSIAEQYHQPSFALNHRGEDSHVLDAFELAGVDYRVVNDRDGRADEVRPTDDASVLGRVLTVLGAPVGPKADQHLSLPAYLEAAPADVRETFVYSYLENRAIEHEGKATLTIQEERNRDYLESLADLVDSVAGGGVSLGEEHITISADATRKLGIVR